MHLEFMKTRRYPVCLDLDAMDNKFWGIIRTRMQLNFSLIAS